MLRRSPLALALVLAIAASACGSCGDTEPPGGAATGAGATVPAGSPTDRVVAALFDLAPRCDVEHRGQLVDFGTDMVAGRVELSDGGELEHVEHHGATWSTIRSRAVTTRFVLPEPKTIFVSARIDPMAAHSVSVHVDDLSLGTTKLKGDDPRAIETSATQLPLDAGEHTVTLRFSPARTQQPYADVDWVRLAALDDLQTTYGAPTLDDVLDRDAVLGKTPRRAFSLRVPSVVRCPIRVVPGARLRASVGMVGAGEGEAEVAVRADASPARALVRAKVKGGEGASWQDLDLSLEEFAGRVVHLELRVPSGSPGSRVLFGDPEVLVASPPPRAPPRAQVVLVVVLSGVERDELPGYAPRAPQHLERLRKLAARATVFRAHRAPTQLPPASFASLLSGLPPVAHTLTDLGARLPAGVPTFVQTAHHASISTATFTGVPQTFAAFGFARGGSRFEMVSPVAGDGRDPIVEATKWIASSLASSPQGKLLAVVHARGGHPPWIVDPKRAEVLPPENYTGDISPRRAAQLLAKVRGRKRFHELPDADQVRLGALHQLAMAEQDRLLGELFDELDDANVEDKSLVIVTGDVSSGLGRLFTDDPPLDERSLGLPLYVVFPGGLHAGVSVAEPTEVFDVTSTVLAALDLQAPQGGTGRDLASIAAGVAASNDEPLVAAAAEARSLRWGSLVVSRSPSRRTTVCDLSIDPTCAFDRRPILPLTVAAFDRSLAAWERRVAAASVFKREPASIDDDTLAALRVWGTME